MNGHQHGKGALTYKEGTKKEGRCVKGVFQVNDNS